MNSVSPRIYQIHYDEAQVQHLDPDLTPYDNAGEKNPLLEFEVFRKIYESTSHPKGELWGALSWKFTQKTGLTGAGIREFISDHPGFDVYYCNPFPEFESLYQNLWVQGETAHPDFLKLNRRVFKAIDRNPDQLLEEIQPQIAFAATNAFIGSSRFWNAYIDFMQDILARLDTNLSELTRERLRSSRADMRGVHAGASYLPFIVERLFTLFLSSEEGRGLTSIKYPVPVAASRNSVHLQRLREMKDTAWQTRSTWLASCWLNYRNLYLVQFHGQAWGVQYIPKITPKKLVFSEFPLDGRQA